MADNKAAYLIQAWNNALVRCLLDQFVENEDHSGQDGDTAQDADQNSLRHDNTDIFAQGEGHDAEGEEAGYGRDGASYDRAEGLADGHTHGFLAVFGILFLVFLIALQQEDRVVSRDSQLQDRRQRLCDIGDGAQEKVAAQVVEDRDADADQEKGGYNIGFRRKQKDNKAQDTRYDYIDGQFLHAQVLDVRDNTGHAADKAALIGNPAHFRQGTHGLVRGGGVVIEDHHQLRVALKKFFSQIVRQQLCGNTDVDHLTVPEHILDMVDLLEFVRHLLYVLHGHTVDDAHGKSTCAELIHHNILTFHRLQCVRKITQKVIVDPRLHNTDH